MMENFYSQLAQRARQSPQPLQAGYQTPGMGQGGQGSRFRSFPFGQGGLPGGGFAGRGALGYGEGITVGQGAQGANLPSPAMGQSNAPTAGNPGGGTFSAPWMTDPNYFTTLFGQPPAYVPPGSGTDQDQANYGGGFQAVPFAPGYIFDPMTGQVYPQHPTIPGNIPAY